MLAVAQSETAARSLGIGATAIRTLAFAVAAVTAGIAGSFYAFLNAYISPDIFTFSDSVRFLLMVILGGAATTFGPVLGAFVLTYLPEYLQRFAEWQKFAYGALLLAGDVRPAAGHPRHARWQLLTTAARVRAASIRRERHPRSQT